MAAVGTHVIAIVLAVLQPIALADPPWTSEQETAKLQNDIKIQSIAAEGHKAMKALAEKIGANVTNQRNIVNGLKSEADKAKRDANSATHKARDLDKQVQNAKLELVKANATLTEAKANFESATKGTSDANATYQEKAAVKNEAVKQFTEATYEKQKAEATLTDCVLKCPDRVPQLTSILNDKKTILADKTSVTKQAQSEWEKAASDLEKAQDAEIHAQKKSSECRTAQEKAQVDYESKKKALDEKLDPEQEKNLLADSFNTALAKQDRIYKAAFEQNEAIGKEIIAKEKSLLELGQVISADRSCIKDLISVEVALKTYRDYLISELTIYKNMAAQKAPAEELKLQGEAVWSIKDHIDNKAVTLNRLQKNCAPANVTIPPVPPPVKCETDTGGTCAWLACHISRNSLCYNGVCVCETGSCAKDGACKARGPPIALAMHAERQNFGVLPTVAVIASVAMGVGFVALRGYSRNVRMPEGLLG